MVVIALRVFITRFWRHALGSRALSLRYTWTNLVADVALFFLFAFSAASLGLDMWLTREVSLKVFLFHQVAYIVTLWCVKAVLFAMYIDIAKKTPKKYSYALYVGGAVTAATGVGCLFTVLLWCRPLKRAWLAPLLATREAGMLSGCSLFGGISIMLHLRLNTARQRTALAFVFCLGLLTMVAASVLLPLGLKLATAEGDAAYDLREGIFLMAVAEVALAIFTCCLPALRVFVRKWIDIDQEGKQNKGGGGGGGDIGRWETRGSCQLL
ncbi:hypothetical protein BDZ91DRAFT_767033 [Kalaharituber pfeilii]|nr:hypothetical protein BDZ91DRAFT_767033 [Kalaharituber pfeilii]